VIAVLVALPLDLFADDSGGGEDELGRPGGSGRESARVICCVMVAAPRWRSTSHQRSPTLFDSFEPALHWNARRVSVNMIRPQEGSTPIGCAIRERRAETFRVPDPKVARTPSRRSRGHTPDGGRAAPHRPLSVASTQVSSPREAWDAENEHSPNPRKFHEPLSIRGVHNGFSNVFPGPMIGAADRTEWPSTRAERDFESAVRNRPEPLRISIIALLDIRIC
jgi:hypothetical protein